jgi:hypothetical protein
MANTTDDYLKLYTKRGKRRKMGPKGGQPPKPAHLKRRRRAPHLSDQELIDRGWDPSTPAGSFIRDLVLSIEPGKPPIDVLALGA